MFIHQIVALHSVSTPNNVSVESADQAPLLNGDIMTLKTHDHVFESIMLVW